MEPQNRKYLQTFPQVKQIKGFSHWQTSHFVLNVIIMHWLTIVHCDNIFQLNAY